MKFPAFAYAAPTTIEEAVDVLANDEDARCRSKIIIRNALGRHSDIFTVKAADALKLDDPALYRRMDRPAFRCVFLQGKMSPRSIVVIGVASKDPLQMALSQDNHVVPALPTYRADDSFGIWILPG